MAVSSSSGSITVNFVGLASGTTYKSRMPRLRLPRFAELQLNARIQAQQCYGGR